MYSCSLVVLLCHVQAMHFIKKIQAMQMLIFLMKQIKFSRTVGAMTERVLSAVHEQCHCQIPLALQRIINPSADRCLRLD